VRAFWRRSVNVQTCPGAALVVMLNPSSAVKRYAGPHVLAPAVTRHAKPLVITGQAPALSGDPA
jgi:hypothetical protein